MGSSFVSWPLEPQLATSQAQRWPADPQHGVSAGGVSRGWVYAGCCAAHECVGEMVVVVVVAELLRVLSMRRVQGWMAQKSTGGEVAALL